MVESQVICEYLDEIWFNLVLMLKFVIDCFEVCWLCLWFDDKFNVECICFVMMEWVWKKVMWQGYLDSCIVKVGLLVICYYMDYMKLLLEYCCWLVGDVMMLVDFIVVVYILCLDYILDVDWIYLIEVQDWYVKIKLCLVFCSLLVDYLLGVYLVLYYVLLDF